MAIASSIEARLAAVEEAIDELRRKSAGPIEDRALGREGGQEDIRGKPAASNWLEVVVGAFEDEPAFDEVIRLGREFRMADRPEDEDDR